VRRVSWGPRPHLSKRFLTATAARSICAGGLYCALGARALRGGGGFFAGSWDLKSTAPLDTPTQLDWTTASGLGAAANLQTHRQARQALDDHGGSASVVGARGGAQQRLESNMSTTQLSLQHRPSLRAQHAQKRARRRCPDQLRLHKKSTDKSRRPYSRIEHQVGGGDECRVI
jgi:hypothetical protein